MININYPMVYAELYEILMYIPIEKIKKIPKVIINQIDNNKDKNYNLKFDINKSLDEQNISEQTKLFLAILFENYWATDEQRNIINLKEKQYRIKNEKEKRNKYNPDNIFKNKATKIENSEKSVAMVEYKESIFEKIKNWLKRTFYK